LLDIEELKNVRVLIVDDKSIGKNGDALGNVRNFSWNPSEVIRLMEEACHAGKPYELLLSDYGIPELDGFTLAEFIKKHENFKNTKIIILSSYNQFGDTVKMPRNWD